MVLRLLIDSVHADETRVAIVDNGRINDFDFVTAAKKQLKGNIYLAKVTRVEPSLQAAFVEYGSGKQGFLPFAEIHPDYYQIPIADREQLLKEVEGTEEGTPEEQAGPISSHPQKSEPEPEEVFLNAEPQIIASLQYTPSIYDTGNDAINDGEGQTLLQATEHVTSEQPQTQGIDEALNELAHSVTPIREPEAQEAENQEIETLANEEDAVRQSRPGSFYRRYKIQEVVKRNQIVLVQVIKEERGNKGVSLTTFISLAGRYCVLMPNSPKGGGISRKISSGEDRRRLKEISSELKTARGMSAIIRTAGIDRSRAEIQRDYEYLVKLWDNIREQTLSSSAPALIYEEGDIIKRTIRDLYTTDIEEIIVAGETGYEQAKSFLNMILPGNSTPVKPYQDNIPLFHAYNIEEQLNSMYDQSVKLRSGGYIVLNPTEALISIDVNSGRSTGERNIEETATKTNLEAAMEIARQLRLRDLAGLIVIDFIDMSDSRNRRAVERAIKDALKADRAKIQIGRISPFGLLEMSRQRLRPSISETSTVPCPHCQGKGVVRSNSSVALQIVRTLEKEASNGTLSEIRLFVTGAIAMDLLNARRDALSAIEQKYAIKIITNMDDSITHGHFRLERVKGARRNNTVPTHTRTPVSMSHTVMDNELPVSLMEETQQAANENSDQQEPALGESGERPRRNRRGGRGRRGSGARERMEAAEQPSSEKVPARTERTEHEEEGKGRRNRSKKWRDRRGKQESGPGESRPSPVGESGAPGSQPSNVIPPVIASPVTVPPLAQQVPQDSKPKKGWWRRIVES